MSRTHPRLWRSAVLVGVLAVMAVACTGGAGPDGSGTGQVETKIVPINTDLDTYFVNVDVTDEGFEPSTVFIPAGQHVRLVVRNRGTIEHHFRVGGLIAEDLAWYVPSEIDETELLAMGEDELAALGIVEGEDLEHIGHHLSPSFVPFKGESAAGVSPLPGELHAYARPGGYDVLSFFATSVGGFVAEDVLNPEIVGRLIVVEADD